MIVIYTLQSNNKHLHNNTNDEIKMQDVKKMENKSCKESKFEYKEQY